MKKSLLTRLTIYFIALALLPLLLFGLISASQTYNTQAAQALTGQSEVAKRVAEQVNSFMQLRENEMYLLADAGNLSSLSLDQQESLLNGLFANQSVYEELTLTNSRGRETIYLSRTKIIETKDLVSRAGSDEFEQPKNSGKTYYSSVSFDEATGEPYIIVSIPLFNLQNGNLSNVLIARVHFKSVWNIMALADATGNGIVYMTDADDFVVAHANPSVVLQKKRAVLPPQNSFATGLDGNTAAIAVETLTLSEQTFYIVAEQPATQALSLAISTIALTLGAMLVAIVIAGVLGTYAARQITTPIGKLAQAASLISEGDFSQTADVQSQDEIGRLAVAFNKMTQQLRDLIANLEARVAVRTQALSSVAEVSTAASSILETDKLLQQVVDLAKERFNFYHSHIYLLNEAGDALALAAGAGEPGRQMVAKGHAIPLNREQSLVARAARERRGVTVNDVTQAPDFLPNPLLPETRSELAVPMIVGDKVLGVFDVQSEVVGRFTEADINVQTALASQVAVAVQNARQYDQTQSALAQSEKLFQASRRLTQSESLQGLVASAVEALGITDIDRVVLGGLDYGAAGELESMTIIANWSKNPDLQATAVGTHYPQAVLSSISLFTSSKPLFFNDMWNDERVDETTKALAKRVNYRMIAALPLFLGSRQNALLLFEGAQPHAFTSDEIRLFNALAPQLATVLENRRQFERAQKEAAREAALNLINQKIQSATTVEAVLQIAARELGHALGAPMTVAQLSVKDKN
ncbi:MAG: GAF domain-containing protein [Anaerolineales bacterium]|nr:GAF domain-containing protein [Anaerolineales bacterium]